MSKRKAVDEVKEEGNDSKRIGEFDFVYFLSELDPLHLLAPIFLPKKTLCQGSWKVFQDELFIFTPENLEPREKIAAFDLGNPWESIFDLPHC